MPKTEIEAVGIGVIERLEAAQIFACHGGDSYER
jgi:hypothetical protein